MIKAEDALHILEILTEHKIPSWLTGGWGIDALLQEKTRPHKDLDILIPVENIALLMEIFQTDGYSLKEIWVENRWVVDSNGNRIPTAFVLQDALGRELDVHAIHLDKKGNAVPAWDGRGLVLTKEDLAGEGLIASTAVRCISAEMQVVVHAGYDLPPEHQRDLERLLEMFDIELIGM